MIHCKPLDTNTWADLEALFGKKGACGGCWCMTWRLSSKDYEHNKGEGNKKLFLQMVEQHQPLGILAYDNEIAIGWCSVSPRVTLKRLQNSRLLKPLDDLPVWSITCLFVKKEYRRKGISAALIKAAANYAFEQGAPVVEAYPMIAKKENVPDVFAYIGLAQSFEKAGFKLLHQPSETRLVMRLEKESSSN
ncbi:MAG: GNAT family N-acetyltransferase [Saprospiraceae bacterium]|nr:GNAT family N-acetyltransferase [Saprospiraceae bacterium]